MDLMNHYSSSDDDIQAQESEEEIEAYKSKSIKKRNQNDLRHFELPIYKQKIEQKEYCIKGYELKMFDKEEYENEIDYQKWLIPCILNETCLVDRYDVRNLVNLKEVKEDRFTCSNSTKDKELDLLRFMDLEEKQEPELEKQNDKKCKLSPEESSSVSTQGDLISTISPAQLKIIKKTAELIVKSNNKLLEIQIMTKQSSNPMFNFMMQQNPLNKIYLQFKNSCRLNLDYSDDEK